MLKSKVIFPQIKRECLPLKRELVKKITHSPAFSAVMLSQRHVSNSRIGSLGVIRVNTRAQCEMLTFSDQKSSWGELNSFGSRRGLSFWGDFVVFRKTTHRDVQPLAHSHWAGALAVTCLALGSLPPTLKHISHFSFTYLSLSS